MGVLNCKCCNSPDVLEINEKLRNRIPDTEVARWLDSRGLGISGTSVGRHRVRCLGIERGIVEPKNPPVIVPDIVDTVPAELPADLPSALQIMLSDQAAIVRQRQLAYAAGECPAPVEDVRLLQTFQTMLREEAILTDLDIPKDASLSAKAALVIDAVIAGRLSASNGERLLGVLHKQVELLEYEDLSRRLVEMEKELRTCV